MSMPFSVIRCEGCDQKWASSSAYGVFLYNLPDGRRAWAARTFAWCGACQSFSTVEIIPKLEELEEKLSAAIAELEEVSKPVEKRVLGFFKVMRQADAETVSIYQKSVKDAQAAVDWRRLRKSEPRCLSCGSHDVHRESVWNSTNIHPGCGGSLKIENSGYSVALRCVDKIYDVEGNFLEEAA